MDRHAFAAWTSLAGLIIGLLGNILFIGHSLGISVPIFVILIIITILATGKAAGKSLSRRNLWPLIPIIFFALMIALRTDWMIVLLDMVAILMLSALTLYYLPLKEPLDEAHINRHLSVTMETAAGVLTSSGPEYSATWSWLKEHGWQNSNTVSAILRGLLITLPVVLLFAILLGSADVVFGKYLEDLWSIIAIKDLGDAIGRVLFIFYLSWTMTGAISYGLARRQRVMPPVADNEQADEEEDANDILPQHPNRAATTPKKRKLSEFSLGIIEAVMLLAGIDLLFAAFVAIQFTYFFGGRENIFNVEGYTFAEYAHRGFAELIIVSLLTLALMLILDRVTIRRQHNHHHIFRALVVFMVAMMAIMLLSASQRMSVYEEAYGFTHLRVYVHAFIFWLGMLFIAFTLEMFRLKINVFSLGVLLVIIGYLITLNLMNIDSYIAHRNMNRLLNNNKQLDVCYLQTLSMDAVPAMIKIRENIDDEDTLDSINRWLNMQLHQLNDIRHNDTFFSYNWSRDRAWNALQPLQNELSYYSTYLGSCSTYVPQGYVP